MDMKKAGSFLKLLRKEKGLTQEQLAETLGVTGRTVSRWENASNMPDLSILIQLSEFYDVDIKEILDGERRNEKSEKNPNDTLKKVADYEREKNEKILKINQTAFLITVFIGLPILLIQFVVFNDIRFILGETVILFAGGITQIILTVQNGVWNVISKDGNTVSKDITVSVIISVIFSFSVFFFICKIIGNVIRAVIYSFCFFILITSVGFAVLRILSAFSRKKVSKEQNNKK